MKPRGSVSISVAEPSMPRPVLAAGGAVPGAGAGPAGAGPTPGAGAGIGPGPGMGLTAGSGGWNWLAPAGPKPCIGTSYPNAGRFLPLAGTERSEGTRLLVWGVRAAQLYGLRAPNALLVTPGADVTQGLREELAEPLAVIPVESRV